MTTYQILYLFLAFGMFIIAFISLIIGIINLGIKK